MNTHTKMSTSWFGANDVINSVDKGDGMIMEGGGGVIQVLEYSSTIYNSKELVAGKRVKH